MRTPRLPVVDWTDAPAHLNGLVRFAERRNLVSARVPSHFKHHYVHSRSPGTNVSDYRDGWVRVISALSFVASRGRRRFDAPSKSLRGRSFTKPQNKDEVVSVFNSAPLSEVMWVGRDTVPRILNLASRWGLVVSTSPREYRHRYTANVVGPQPVRLQKSQIIWI